MVSKNKHSLGIEKNLVGSGRESIVYISTGKDNSQGYDHIVKCEQTNKPSIKSSKQKSKCNKVKSKMHDNEWVLPI